MSDFTVQGSIKAPANRIISLAPSITELLFYLGLGESVAGVTQQCDYPDSVKAVRNIGSFLMPEVERIMELSPDIIVGLSDLHKHVPETISDKETGVILFNYRSVQDVLDAMEILASLAVDTGKAMELVAFLRRRVDALRVKSDGKSPARALFLIYDDRIFIPGRSSYQYDALKIAGAAQVSSGYGQYERVTLEEVVYFDPEVILACGSHRNEPPRRICPGCQSEQPVCQRIVEDIAVKPGWKETKAASNGNIIALPCHWLCRPGPRLIDGMEKIAEILVVSQTGLNQFK